MSQYYLSISSNNSGCYYNSNTNKKVRENDNYDNVYPITD